MLDGVGIGELPDAHLWGDQGSATLQNICKQVNISLPNLTQLGLGNIESIIGVNAVSQPLGSYGKMTEVSPGKDSTTGHWELGGIHLDFDFSYFPQGFTKEIMDLFLEKTGCKGFLGNKAASGTEIIQELGDEHLRTGFPIVYTSADSVFQIAAHEEVIKLEELYRICEITRNEVLTEPLKIGRVIARPFLGGNGNYTRTKNRKDFSLDAPYPTILDEVKKSGRETVAIGKINDLFNHRGITKPLFTKSNEEGIEAIIQQMQDCNNSLIFANLVDFDVYYGHRNDPIGFAKALEYFDSRLPEILTLLDEGDMLLLTADHGNDPTTSGTDHSREYVPILAYTKSHLGKNLGIRSTFSDVASTVADFFGLETKLKGTSFLNEIGR